MTTPASQAAAAAWLARIPVADRLAAHARTDTRLLVWLGAGVIMLLVAAAIGRSGVIGRVKRQIEAGEARPWLTSLAAAAVLVLALATARGLFDALIAWPAEGQGAGGVMANLAQAARGVPPALSAAVLLIPPLMWLIRVRPRMWSLILGPILVVLSLAVGWAPYAFGRPGVMILAPPGPVQAGLSQLIAQSGIPARGVYLSPDPGFDADVTGGFGQATVVVGRKVLAWPAPEARAYVGHLVGHYRHGDVFALFLIYGLVAFAALGAMQRLAPLSRRLGAHGVRGAADPEALPAMAMIAVLCLGGATLAAAGYLRWANVRADQTALDLSGQPDGLAAVLERNWDHQSVDPNPVEETIFYSHPPLAKRLDLAMAWKAAHGG